MDFVTITDHDTIDGSLQLAEFPDTFISEEVTTYFPQDPCKIHLLVWGITEAQHAEIAALRDNIFELQAYLQKAEITHSVAHPLYSINGKLDASHLERLILLFKHFEGVNGLRDALLSVLAQKLLSNLTPEKIEELANRHNLAAHPSRAVEESLHGRIGRSRRPLRGQRPHGNAAGAHGGAIPPARSRWQLHRPRRGRHASRAIARLLQHGFPFHPGPFHRAPGAERPPAGDDVLAFHGRTRSDRVHPAGKGDLYRAGRDVGKNLRTGEAGQRLALERALESFRAAEGESATGEGDGRSDRAGAPHLPDGESRLRTARISALRKIRPANPGGEHHGKHAGVERDRADHRAALALHLCASTARPPPAAGYATFFSR